MRSPVAAINNRVMHRRVDALLRACAARGGPPLPPVPVEWIAEHILDLSIVWDALPTRTDAPVLGGIHPERGEIVLNERELQRFTAFPGQEAFTLAHEIGHWLLHIAPARRRQPLLPGLDRSRGHSACGGITPEAAAREQQADRFAALLLMPESLLRPRCESLDLSRFPARYLLRDQFGVSITAMNLRLHHLGYGNFDDADRFIPGPRTPTLAAAARPSPNPTRSHRAAQQPTSGQALQRAIGRRITPTPATAIAPEPGTDGYAQPDGLMRRLAAQQPMLPHDRHSQSNPQVDAPRVAFAR